LFDRGRGKDLPERSRTDEEVPSIQRGVQEVAGIPDRQWGYQQGSGWERE